MADADLVTVLQGILARLDAIESKLPVSAPAPSPGVVTAPSIWDGLLVTDALAKYESTDAGWLNTNLRFVDFPGDRVMLNVSWLGVEPPTGRVLHGGDTARMHAARKLALQLHDHDVAGRYDGTEYAILNISPEVAACLLCLRLVDVTTPLFGAGLRPDQYANITDLQALFLKLKAASEGTGGPSGM